MKDINHMIDKALNEQPDYSRLDSLSVDVWDKVRAKRKARGNGLRIPLGLKVGTAAMCLIAIFAISQISLSTGQLRADLFDLRFFSYQSAPSLNFASVNTYELQP